MVKSIEMTDYSPRKKCSLWSASQHYKPVIMSQAQNATLFHQIQKLQGFLGSKNFKLRFLDRPRLQAYFTISTTPLHCAAKPVKQWAINMQPQRKTLRVYNTMLSCNSLRIIKSFVASIITFHSNFSSAAAVTQITSLSDLL